MPNIKKWVKLHEDKIQDVCRLHSKLEFAILKQQQKNWQYKNIYSLEQTTQTISLPSTYGGHFREPQRASMEWKW